MTIVRNTLGRLFPFYRSRTAAPALAGFDSSVVIKQNRQRTVYRAERNGETFFVKSCRIDGPRAWFRDFFRGPKAKLEFQNARRLSDLGIAAVEPVAWSGRRWPGTSTITTRAVPHAMPLSDFLTERLPYLARGEQRRLRRTLATSLGRYFASLTAAGATHPDPHPGNLLVRFDPAGEASFTLLDVHAIQFRRSLSNQEILANLVLFNRWFILRTSRAERFRFWAAYRAVLGRFERDDARRVERETVQSNLRFWSRRFGRYFGTNREFVTVRNGRHRGFAIREPFDGVFVGEPDRVFLRKDTTVLKTSRSSTVISLPDEALPGKRYVFKRVPIRSWFDPIRNLFRDSSVRRSWQYGQSLRDRFLPTPRPVLMVHRYRYGLPSEGYLLVEEWPGAITLDWAVQQVEKHSDRRRILRRWAERLGRLVRLMHDRGIRHGDLKAANVLVQVDDARPANSEFSFIDFAGVRATRTVSRKARVEDLARLAASFRNYPAITHSVRWHFLDAYGRVPPVERIEWNEVAMAVAAKIRRNARRGRALG